MVRGRRVKAIIPNACVNGKDYYSLTKKNSSSGKKLLTTDHGDHLITQYFSIGRIQADQTDTKGCGNKRKIPLNIGYCPKIKIKSEDRNTTAVKDNYLVLDNEENFSKMFVASSPHRIELCSQFSNSEEPKLPEMRSESNLKFNENKKFKNKNKTNKTPSDHKLTEYYPVRRSVRKTKKTILEEKQREIEELLRSGIEEGLEVHNFEGKGRGVVATRPFNQGDFVVEYSGELLDVAEAKHRENVYAQDMNTGCYMYYFKYQNQQYCVDATAESGRLGRLVNHSRNGNLMTRTVVVDGLPRLVLIAKENIRTGDEISYDYGDRSKESLKHHPWLAF